MQRKKLNLCQFAYPPRSRKQMHDKDSVKLGKNKSIFPAVILRGGAGQRITNLSIERFTGRICNEWMHRQ